eukprot:gnl/Chilomastix_caulleri/1931.p2 GENE.gnl/Chilomastix_caulleri/1931~~gnl/Chilomastix_caulleri/1931.p2  ORF type:complete len:104 (+),score=37.48 gnl/Chilomastix_caulleri/1931:281-592(+)
MRGRTQKTLLALEDQINQMLFRKEGTGLGYLFFPIDNKVVGDADASDPERSAHDNPDEPFGPSNEVAIPNAILSPPTATADERGSSMPTIVAAVARNAQGHLR